ncbi:MAG: tyrosine-type recombinase/integrase [Thermoguttaceae bacterium]
MSHSKPKRVPAYRLHKPSGQARVIINGEHLYLGIYGSPESQEKYARLLAELAVSRQNGKTSHKKANGSTRLAADPDLLICQLVRQYHEFAKGYFVRDSEPGKECVEIKMSLRPLLTLYGTEKARSFGPLALKAVRQLMVDSDLSRGVVNHRVNRVKRLFKWAVSEELVPSSVYEGLRTVTGLLYGRTKARETDPVKPVEKQWVDAVIPHVWPPVAAMIQVQWFAGMRPGEVVLMRPCDIDMTADIWIYEPHDHKNRWRNHRRQIPLGPKAQAIIRPFLLNRADTAYLFSPKDGEATINAERRRNRKSPMTPSQAKRRPKKHSTRAKRERYDTHSYLRAITYGIEQANKNRKDQPQVPDWCPLQIRHSRATEVRKQHGLEAAQVALGHKNANITEVYAEKNLALAVQIAKESG